MADAMAPRELLTVRVLGIPLTVWARAEEHIDGLLREFTLILASEAQGGETHVPRRLLELIDELEGDYAALTSEQRSQLVAAAEHGRDTIDLEYRVPPDVADACRRLEQALDAADRYCAEGEYLLTLATPSDALAFRQWYLGEFVRQIGGQPPQPWAEWAAARGISTGSGDR